MMETFFKQSDATFVKDALLSQLAVAVKEVQTNLEPVEGNSDNTASSLLTVIEAIFIHGLKETLMNKMSQVILTDVGQRPDPNFWTPLLIFSHRDVISQINHLTQVTTDVGRGRAWLRLALNEGLLSSYMHSMAADNTSLKPYYNNNAFLRDFEKLDVAKQLIEGIETCAFSLVCNSSLLNVWTNMPLLMAGLSTAPLRSCPIVRGTDVAQTLGSGEVSGSLTGNISQVSSAYNYTNYMINSRSLVDEEEALKIILGTPVNESPLQVRADNDKQIEEAEIAIAGNDSKSNKGELINKVKKTQVKPAVPEETIKSNLPKPIDNSTIAQLYENEVQSTIPKLKSSSVLPVISPSQQSYNSLLSSYNKVTGIGSKSNLKDTIQQYEESTETSNISQELPVETALVILDQNNLEISSTCDFEVVPVNSTISNSIPEYANLVQYLSTLAREQGLDSQNYSCSYCKHPVGVNLENFSLCNFTGNYYCKECYGYPTEEWIIPARVLHNWDFRKYPVSQKANTFLNEVQDHPLLDLKAINPRLYVVIDEMAQMQALRMQLNLLRAYLFTCREPIGEDLKKKIWPKEYLYEHVHLYSISDLTKIPNGILTQMLEKAVSFSRQHVLACSLCKQKGFICEICSKPPVIYPFDLDSTYKCRVCSTVFHSQCLNCTKPCPKCERQKKRQQQDLHEA